MSLEGGWNLLVVGRLLHEAEDPETLLDHLDSHMHPKNEANHIEVTIIQWVKRMNEKNNKTRNALCAFFHSLKKH